MTFATNRDAGLCIRFAEPVPAIDPFEKILHPGITVTVEQVEDLQRRLTPSASTEAEEDSGGVPAESPGAVGRRWARWPFGMMLITLHVGPLRCRVAEMAKGTVVGKPEVRTVRYES